MVAALVLVAPTDCGCGVDLHGGEPFHPVFSHPHPDAPPESNGLADSASGQLSLHSVHALSAGVSFLTTGEVLPRLSVLPEPIRPPGRLARSGTPLPPGLSFAPQEPPPELA